MVPTGYRGMASNVRTLIQLSHLPPRAPNAPSPRFLPQAAPAIPVLLIMDVTSQGHCLRLLFQWLSSLFLTPWLCLLYLLAFLDSTNIGNAKIAHLTKDVSMDTLTIFFSTAALSGSFGGLLGAAIQNMDGLGGKAGWRWIFIIEGLLTVGVGIASFWMVHDFPDDTKFLSDQDRDRVIRGLKMDQQSSAEHEQFKMSYVWAALSD